MPMWTALADTSLVVAVDIGGTFTDIALYDAKSGQIWRAKTPSVPADPSQAFLAGVRLALHPDDPEGAWLIAYLRQAGIPYFAFRGYVPGKATGAHIHIGPPSNRLLSRGS